jgi:putative endonuclease
MSYFVYILESNRSRHYIGFTSNLQARIKKHNCKHKGFTGTTEVWKIIFYKEIVSKKEAIQLERELKAFKNYRRAIEYLKR